MFTRRFDQIILFFWVIFVSFLNSLCYRSAANPSLSSHKMYKDWGEGIIAYVSYMKVEIFDCFVKFLEYYLE